MKSNYSKVSNLNEVQIIEEKGNFGLWVVDLEPYLHAETTWRGNYIKMMWRYGVSPMHISQGHVKRQPWIEIVKYYIEKVSSTITCKTKIACSWWYVKVIDKIKCWVFLKTIQDEQNICRLMGDHVCYLHWSLGRQWNSSSSRK